MCIRDSETFGLSYTASNRALSDYRQWFTRISRRSPRRPLAIEQKLESRFRPLPEEPASRPSRRSQAKKRLTKRQREMDERASFFQEQRLIYGEDYVFHMLEEQWLCGNAR